MERRITFIGHATVLVEMDGCRLLTDPVLRSRLIHLRRHGRAVDVDVQRDLDGVLLSHLHHDHFDVPSLKLLERWTPVVVPRGAGKLARSAGFTDVREVVEGDTVELSRFTVTAVPADHDDRRWPRGGPRAAPLGYVIEGAGTRTYFAGDTDVFPGMGAIGDLGIEVALLPVWGWGPTIGPGHMNPSRAAEAIALLRPQISVPIHWGTLYPVSMHRWRPGPLVKPGDAFVAAAAHAAPGADVRIVEPGGALVLDADGARVVPPA
ncbi:MAG: MBL fold metallo-hydrolase [Solirubrobacteraceae bacterium]|nr:MBL fold metallo-hydrolase [Solirubrobacteraceae bacterium]